jgi:hypothetical protein
LKRAQAGSIEELVSFFDDIYHSRESERLVFWKQDSWRADVEFAQGSIHIVYAGSNSFMDVQENFVTKKASRGFVSKSLVIGSAFSSAGNGFIPRFATL